MTSIQLWFGDVDVGNGDVVASATVESDVSSIIRRLKSGGFTEFDKRYRGLFRSIAIKSGIVGSEEEYVKTVRAIAIQLARERVAEAEGQKDQQIIQAIEAIDDIDKSINLLSERLSEWSGFKFEDLKGEDLVSALTSSDDATEMAPLRELAHAVLNLQDARRHIADDIIHQMREVAPNTSNIAGELLGARFISKAGSLQNLAKMPSSSVQVIGASKALFKHLRYGAKPPKHGIIYKHPLVHGSTPSQRGKISRIVASKIAIAARLDDYSHAVNPELLTELEKRIERVKSSSAYSRRKDES